LDAGPLPLPTDCWDCGCDDDFWLRPLDDGTGVVDERRDVVVEVPDRDVEVELEPEPEPGVVEVELGVVLELDELDEDEPRGGGSLGIVTLDVLELVLELLLDGAHDSDTRVLPGGSEGDTPGGTFAVNVSVWPVGSLTVTVQVLADAGTLPSTSASVTALASASMEISLRRRVKAALLLRPSCSCALQCGNERSLRRGHGSY
jgi:hypothetical protein